VDLILVLSIATSKKNTIGHIRNFYFIHYTTFAAHAFGAAKIMDYDLIMINLFQIIFIKLLLY